MTKLHPLAADMATTYQNLADREAPGLVQGLYLTGSVALNDFRPRTSDVDFVAVTAAKPGTSEMEALERAHTRLRALRRRPFFDGFYLTWDDLRRGPEGAAPGLFAHERRLQVCSRLSPVTWFELAGHGVTLRGPEPADLAIWADKQVLSDWTRGNLDGYWRRWHSQSSQLGSVPGVISLGAWATMWGVLGVSRLHFTLATGQVTAKEGAGLYALEAFPARWHRVINEALRIRRGDAKRSLYRNPLRRRCDALDFVSVAIEDAKALHRAASA
ncbi:MAG TPA: aminoglycoside adenylyltransferase domain-containing protein [Streptosporangiaceae bacterium]|nr:aminoglycoside adenylyltransferase domain-containing protein [Streptosporangiaceae bacterium]